MKMPRHLLPWTAGLLRWLATAFLLCAAPLAFAQANPKDFDHLKTGFALTGVHGNERCDSCHVNGVFKGTPRDCATCHTSGSRFARSNVVKPQRHIPTRESCDTCHSTRQFAGATFNHVGVQPGSCATCHNGNLSQGKPAGHVATQASCDSCHRSTAWRPAAGFDHASVAPGTCASCHNGSRATSHSERGHPRGSTARWP